MKDGMVRWAERGRAFLGGPRAGALLATVLTLGLLLGVWWQAQLWYGTRLAADERAIVTSEVVPYGNALTSATNRRFALLAGLRAFTEVQFRSPGGMSEAEFETFAAGLYATTSGIRNLVVAPGGVTGYIYPRAGYESLLNHDLIHDERPNVRADVQRTIQTHQIALSDPYTLTQGGLGAVARQAVYEGDRFLGLVIEVLDLPPLFSEAGLDRLSGSLDLAVRDGAGKVFYGQGGVFGSQPVTYPIALPEGSWELAGVPAGGWDAAVRGSLFRFQGVGLLLVALIAALVYLVSNRQARLGLAVRERTAELGHKMAELEQVAAQLHRVNRALKTLTACNQALVHETDELGLLREVCRVCVEIGGYRMAWVGYAEQDEQKSVRPVASAGYDDGNLDLAKITWADMERGRGPTGTAVRTGKPVVGRDLQTLPHDDAWRAEAMKRGYASSIALPLMAKGLPLGALSLYAGEPDAFGSEEIESLTELADDLTYGMMALRTQVEHQQAEEEIRSLARFPGENPNPVMRVDQDGIILYANEASRPLLREWGCEVGSPAPEFWRDLVAGALVAGETRSAEVTCEERVYSFIVDPIGEAGYANLYGRDVTERKLAEEALRRERDLLTRVMETSPAGITVIDREGRVTFANVRAEQVLGLTRDKITGLTYNSSAWHVTDYDGQPFPDEKLLFRQLMNTGQPVFDVRHAIEWPDGQRRLLSINGAPILDDAGQISSVVFAIDDITERILADEALQESTERLKALHEEVQRYAAELEDRVAERTTELEKTNAELDAFAYSVSHDLRAPLRAMQGFSQALLEDYADRLDAVGQDHARRVVGAAQRMDTLIQDLLAYSHLGRTQVQLEPVSLRRVVADVLAQLEAEIQEKHAQVTVEKPLPHVIGHYPTLVQSVANLLANAIKFVAPGVQPQVQVYAEDRGEAVRLWVQDNGIGIAPEHQGQIFHVFERLHAVESYPGTGIGLAIVRKAIEQMGGQVGVESQIGQGSRFWVELPKRRRGS